MKDEGVSDICMLLENGIFYCKMATVSIPNTWPRCKNDVHTDILTPPFICRPLQVSKQ